jgi:hypothetical protein
MGFDVGFCQSCRQISLYVTHPGVVRFVRAAPIGWAALRLRVSSSDRTECSEPVNLGVIPRMAERPHTRAYQLCGNFLGRKTRVPQKKNFVVNGWPSAQPLRGDWPPF